MKKIRTAGWALLCLAIGFGVQAQNDDPYLWLEEVEDPAALEWVVKRNEATLAALQAHPEFEGIKAKALEILDAADRIAYPSIMGGFVYNFWQDATHPRGIWRRTVLESYLAGEPEWEVMLDIDALGSKEDVNWVYRGAACRRPEYTQCLVYLSRGGADAVEIREFDLKTRAFVPDGFFLPEAKGSVSWIDENTVYVRTDFGDGSLTTSGYPRQVRRWTRGTSPGDAELVFEGEPSDVSVWAGVTHTDGRVYHVLTRSLTFYTSEVYVVIDGKPVRLDVPADAAVSFFGDLMLVELKSDWTVDGTAYPQGALLSVDYDAFMAGLREFQVVVAPQDRSSLASYWTTKNTLVVNRLTNVSSELFEYRVDNGSWSSSRVDAPAYGDISGVAADDESDRHFFTYTGFLDPTTLYYGPATGETPRLVRSLPAYFDGSRFEVHQYEAVSEDGTRVPYFLVHAKELERDGSNPTLLYGYGGFEVSETPRYSALLGAAWLERGGVYALANIRGGGEFGPGWHQAALKENRQRAYDDFFAVAEDLIARGVTSPRHLGVQGGSNGGLLVGVALTQRPDLFNAVVCQVPLLDMKRYNKLLAGASWMAEYGDPDIPEEWAYISKYSPYQNVFPDRRYPRTLFTTTTRDDRVHPGHARKMVAWMTDQGHDVLYHEQVEGGHGSGSTNEQRALSAAIVYTYLLEQLAAPGGAQ